MKKFNLKNKYYFLASILMLFLGVLSVQAASVSDAIAIRVYKNLNHYSALDWYQDKGFKGAPQSIIIDGYEAIRDGRTVYVNVGNVTGNNLYTNIYVISYTSQAEPATVDIFGKILISWKFNSNLTELGTCSITRYNCKEQTDCPNQTTCQEGKCLLNEPIKCLTDSRCPNNYFCDSFKASITRDTRRLADIARLKKFTGLYGFPTLEGGTYQKNYSISVWPSWQEVLGQGLKNTLPYDPINSLKGCTTNINTCWDDVNKVFEGVKPGSYVYSYTYSPTTPQNSGFQISNFESSRFGIAQPN